MQILKIKAWLRLAEFKNLKQNQIIDLVNLLGCPSQYIGRKSDLWEKVDFINPQIIDLLQKDTNPENWNEVEKICNEFPIHFISILDELYPDELRNIFQVPLFLFALGDISVLQIEKKAAVVGTRKPSAYGRLMTNQIAKQLCSSGYVIVSGLAMGIDAEAHKAALEANGKTIAVLAHGLEIIYPPQNRELAKEIIQNGLLITEYPPATKMNKWYFIQRNRIISALSRCTAVIEGKKHSGAMLTAKFALEQGKDIFALPGNINLEFSEGPNYLIQQGAQCINNPSAINQFYEENPNNLFTPSLPELNPEEEFIYNIIKSSANEIHMDELVILTAYDFGKLSSTLFMLELKNVIKKTEGNRYIALI